MRPSLESQGDARRQVVALPGGTGLVFDIGQLHVVAGDPEVDAPVRQRCGEFGRGLRKDVQDAPGHRAADDIGDALGHLGDRVVAELPDGDHVGAQPVDHE